MSEETKPALPSGVVIQKARPRRTKEELENLPTPVGRIQWSKSEITSMALDQAEEALARKIVAESDVVSLSWWRKVSKLFRRKAK